MAHRVVLRGLRRAVAYLMISELIRSEPMPAVSDKTATRDRLWRSQSPAAAPPGVVGRPIPLLGGAADRGEDPSQSRVIAPVPAGPIGFAFFALSDRVAPLVWQEGLAVSNIRRPAGRADPRELIWPLL